MSSKGELCVRCGMTAFNGFCDRCKKPLAPTIKTIGKPSYTRGEESPTVLEYFLDGFEVDESEEPELIEPTLEAMGGV